MASPFTFCQLQMAFHLLFDNWHSWEQRAEVEEIASYLNFFLLDAEESLRWPEDHFLGSLKMRWALYRTVKVQRSPRVAWIVVLNLRGLEQERMMVETWFAAWKVVIMGDETYTLKVWLLLCFLSFLHCFTFILLFSLLKIFGKF